MTSYHLNQSSDGILQVIQNALHTNHVKHSDDVIRGLQPILLPNYLSLRTGGDLPNCLRRAHDEEKRFRLARVTSKKRKRTRGRERAMRGETANVDSKRSHMLASSTRNLQETAVPNDNAKRMEQKRVNSFDKEKGEDIDTSEWFYYRMIARIVIAPYTPFLIETLRDLEIQSVQSSDEVNERFSYQQPTKKAKVTVIATDNPIENATANEEPSPISPVRNMYLKFKKPFEEKASNYIPLSSPRESLESLVDGVVCKLVQRTRSLRNRCPPNVKAKNTKPIYRRRQRKKKKSLPQSVNDVSRPLKPIGSAVNNWLRSSNILSKGYSLGGSDTLSSSFYSLKTNIKFNNTTLQACPNMAPGVHCIQPNSVTTYARSSRLMRLLHSMIGDEILMELLLNAVVLIPAVDENLADREVPSIFMHAFRKGNYFQMCGPPLNIVTRQFELMKMAETCNGSKGIENRESTVKAAVKDISKSRKRKQNSEESKPGSLDGWNPNKPIPRSKLFYCDFYARHVGLSPNHVLNQDSNDDFIEDKVVGKEKIDFSSNIRSNSEHNELQLLNAMVELWPRRSISPDSKTNITHTNKRRLRWRRLRKTGMVMCKNIMRRHKACDYARLLEKHCPLLVDKNLGKHDLDPKQKVSHLVKLYTPNENIVSFMKAVLWNAFPSTFWGSEHNFFKVIKNLKVFINLRLAETFPEKLIVDGIRVADMKWLHQYTQKEGSSTCKKLKLSRTAHESAVVMIRNVMRWVYREYITPLLRSTFYITDTEFTGRRVVYYRKPVWAQIRSLSMGILLKRQYRERSIARAKKLLTSHNVGCPPAPLRLLPKKTGIRAIAMLSKASVMEGEETANAGKILAPNKILQSTFQALKYEYKKRSVFGAGALGVTEVFPAYCSFLDAMRRKSLISNNSAVSDTPQLYFTSADIEHCYDNINQDHLFKQIRSIVEEDHYITQNHFILHSHDKNRATRCRWKKTTCSPANFSDISSISKAHSKQFYNSITIDGIHFSVEKRHTIIGLLKDHIFGQIICSSGSNGQKLLLQRNGIPQGSILSSLFCNAYFGNLEDKMFDGVFDKNSLVIKGSTTANHKAALIESTTALHLLLRIVDDFLLISTDYDTSLRFLKALKKGVPRLRVKVNNAKTRVNYKTNDEEIDSSNIFISNEDTATFAWCGLLIDTKTCEIRIDGDRFAGSLATDNVIVHRSGREGFALSKKIRDFIKPRCHQELLFSPLINSPDTIRINFYQTFMLCARKTIHYLKSMGGSHSKRFKFVYNIVCDTIHYALLLVSSRSHRILSPDTKTKDAQYLLTLKEALWLGHHAFYSVIGRESGFKELRDLFHERRNVPVHNRGELVSASKRALRSWRGIDTY